MKKNATENTLIILTGPTGVGKTELGIHLAEYFRAPVVSADSRQFYKDIPIGSAAPTAGQKQRAQHYMTGMLELTDYYSAACFEADVLALLDKLYMTTSVALMTGGSMMYIDAVCKGIDDIPTVTSDIRKAVYGRYEAGGLAPLLEELKTLDPAHYDKVDRQNYKRVLHALEICLQTGKPYSAFRTNSPKERPFGMVKIGLTLDREELRERINRRVEDMMACGLLKEAQSLYPMRHLNALNTIGYKELFEYFDGSWTLDFAIEKIKRNSRVYARKQMTWLKRDREITWFNPSDEAGILEHIKRFMPSERIR
ncbi:MAG: tRNA (adenosine(37)-N6)-dimethylallyltransferase MiaA [Tannerellaceae bacterium]|nr:tRNA (adenosine(37)-N6)-dimethylallyltransferase MiaA [Tannerellaceae bacterium]